MATALPPGCHVREGRLRQPNGAPALAYRMWTNTPDLTTPAAQPTVTATSTSTDDQQPDTRSRLNVLLLHDLHDNCASFTALAPALLQALAPACCASPPAVLCLLAVDLPGHGLSDWRPRDGNYASIVHVVSDLSQLLMQGLRWDECVLVGHGEGARIAALLAASAALQQHPPAAMALVPRMPTMLGCVLLDPFPYDSWRLPAGCTDADYARESMRQGSVNGLTRSIPERMRLQRTRKELHPSFEHAVAAFHSVHPDVELSSVRTLLSRGLKRVRRPRSLPSPDALAPLAACQADEREVDERRAAEAAAVAAHLAAAVTGRAAPEPPLPPFDPRSEEVGWVDRSDPLLRAPSLLTFSRSQYGAALRSIVAPTLLLHARTQSSGRDGPFLRHVDSLVADSPCDARSAAGGSVREVCADRMLHLDGESAGEVAGLVGSFVRDCWNDRANARLEEARAKQELKAYLKACIKLNQQQEARFYAATLGAASDIDAPGAARAPLSAKL